MLADRIEYSRNYDPWRLRDANGELLSCSRGQQPMTLDDAKQMATRMAHGLGIAVHVVPVEAGHWNTTGWTARRNETLGPLPKLPAGTVRPGGGCGIQAYAGAASPTASHGRFQAEAASRP